MTLDAATVKRLAALSRKARDSTTARDAAICEVYAEGGGLREIARAVGLSHAGVRRVLVRNGLAD